MKLKNKLQRLNIKPRSFCTQQTVDSRHKITNKNQHQHTIHEKERLYYTIFTHRWNSVTYMYTKASNICFCFDLLCFRKFCWAFLTFYPDWLCSKSNFVYKCVNQKSDTLPINACTHGGCEFTALSCIEHSEEGFSAWTDYIIVFALIWIVFRLDELHRRALQPLRSVWS